MELAARWALEAASIERVPEDYTARKLFLRWAKLRTRGASHPGALRPAITDFETFNCDSGTMR